MTQLVPNSASAVSVRCGGLAARVATDAAMDGLKRWDALTLVLRDGRACIDNSAAERAIRPLALGRRNWTFAGDDRRCGRSRAADRLRRRHPSPWRFRSGCRSARRVAHPRMWTLHPTGAPVSALRCQTKFARAERLVGYGSSALSSSFASLRSGVPKPSVNQP